MFTFYLFQLMFILFQLKQFILLVLSLKKTVVIIIIYKQTNKQINTMPNYYLHIILMIN